MFLNKKRVNELITMLKGKVNRRLEKRSVLGIWKKVDIPELMGIDRDHLKEIEYMLINNQGMQKIMKYVEDNMPDWTVSYCYREGVHIITIENKKTFSKKRIVFEVE
ncbi:MAG: hypothetical protein ACP5KJ_01705 [Candidatus Micrarchaeia archaeon]